MNLLLNVLWLQISWLWFDKVSWTHWLNRQLSILETWFTESTYREIVTSASIKHPRDWTGTCMKIKEYFRNLLQYLTVYLKAVGHIKLWFYFLKDFSGNGKEWQITDIKFQLPKTLNLRTKTRPFMLGMTFSFSGLNFSLLFISNEKWFWMAVWT